MHVGMCPAQFEILIESSGVAVVPMKPPRIG